MANPLQPIVQPLSEPPPDSGFEADSKVPAGLVVLFLILKLLLVVGIIFLGCMLCLLMRFCWFCVFGKEVAGKAGKSPGGGQPPSASNGGGGGGAAAGGGAPVTPGAVGGSDQTVRMQCTIPDGMKPNQQLTWLSPSGKLVAMTIPEGSEPGSILEFRVPTVVMHERPGGAMAASPASAATASPRGETQGATPGTTQGGTPGATCPPEWGP